MSEISTTLDRLLRARAELRRRGIGDIAAEIDGAIADLRATDVKSDSAMMTTGEAAKALGVRSVNTVKRWAGDGMLDGYRRGGRILVTRTSVERLLHDSRLAVQQQRERDLDAALAPFDADDELLAPPSATWDGRLPWNPDADRSR